MSLAVVGAVNGAISGARIGRMRSETGASLETEERSESADGGGGAVAAAEGSVDYRQFFVGAGGLGVDMADQLEAGQHREGVVTTNAFCGRRINLPGVVEVPELQCEPPVVDERVENGSTHSLVSFPVSNVKSDGSV